MRGAGTIPGTAPVLTCLGRPSSRPACDGAMKFKPDFTRQVPKQVTERATRTDSTESDMPASLTFNCPDRRQIRQLCAVADLLRHVKLSKPSIRKPSD